MNVIASVHDVADLIIDRMGGEDIRALTLQKLCYYVQAWHLAWHGVPAFREELQAWRHGPVVPTLWAAHEVNDGSFEIRYPEMLPGLTVIDLRRWWRSLSSTAGVSNGSW
ncbi:MAG: DUF4065 domain-containing protein [Polyangiales bacterium]